MVICTQKEDLPSSCGCPNFKLFPSGFGAAGAVLTTELEDVEYVREAVIYVLAEFVR